MQALWQDFRYAARTMRRNSGFTVAAVVTLALGIGANTAVFGIVHVLAMKPLPYADAARVAFVLGQDAETGATRFSMRVAEYLDVRTGVPSLADVAAYNYLNANLTGGDIPERVQAYHVTANTFALLGVPPAIGRPFVAADGHTGSVPVVIVSHGLWQRRFGSDPAAVGRHVTINGTVHEIVGVMPPGFEYPVFNFKGDAWLPWQLDESAAASDRGTSGSATLVARVAPGATFDQAQSELQALMRRLAADYPQTNRTLSARVVQMGRLDDEAAGPAITLAFVSVGLVLLLACANVANLLLARGWSRSRELAVRAAVGATRWRIVRQLIVESLLLALAGALGGVLMAAVALRALVTILPEMIVATVPNITSLGIDTTVLAFTILIAVASSLLAGVLPAWRAAQPTLQDGLREGAAAGGTKGTRRLRGVLVVSEIALATLLVIAAALLARSHAALGRVDPGFRSDRVLSLATSLPADRYPDATRRTQFYESLVQRLSTAAGIESAGLVNVLPFSTYDRGTRFVVDGGDAPSRGDEPAASFRIASPGYFTTLGIPLHAGRLFDARDRAASERVALVNRRFVERYLGAGEPLGRRVRLATTDPSAPWITIVGVIGDVHHSQLTGPPDPELYLPLSQAAQTAMMMLAVRTDGDPEAFIPLVRAEILALDPLQPVYHVKPMARMLDDARMAGASTAWLMGIFSAIALVLALVGIYGVVSYGVTQQMPEFGVRLALGATPGRLVGLVVRQGGRLVLIGILLGAAGAYVLSAGLRTLLFGIASTDPATYVLTMLAMAGLGGLACLVPAVRAASAGPLAALRSE